MSNKLSITKDVGVSYLKPLSRNIIYAGTATPGSGGGGTVINNQDITITENGVYTASAGYTGIGTATVNVTPVLSTLNATTNGTYTPTSPSVGFSSVVVETPEPDIVTATNTTGASIAEDGKVWLEKVAGGYNALDFISAKNKITLDKVGAPVVSLIAQGFSADNRLAMATTTIPDFDAGDCTLYIKIKTAASQPSHQQQILSTSPSIVSLQMLNNKLRGWSSAASSAYDVATLSNSTWYWVKVVCSGTDRTIWTSMDGVSYNTSYTYTDNAVSGSDVEMQVGGYTYNTSWFFFGEIDLNAFYIENAEGNVVWRAIDDGILTGFAQESIATSGTGAVKTALGDYINVEVEVDADNAEITVA